MTFSKKLCRNSISVLAAVAMAAGLHAAPAVAQAGPAVTSTLDVCADSATGNWRYSGVVVVAGKADDGSGLAVDYMVQNKTSRDGYATVYKARKAAGPGSALMGGEGVRVIPFSFDAPPLTLGTLRNVVRVQAYGQSRDPKLGTTLVEGAALTEPVCGCGPRGCVRTQGYWSNKPKVDWPGEWNGGMSFWASGYSWQEVFDMPVRGNAYIMLAHQFMAATLNRYAGASTPPAIEELITTARAWFTSGTNIETCAAKGSCEQQKAWAAAFDLYNNGLYPGGPPHCPD